MGAPNLIEFGCRQSRECRHRDVLGDALPAPMLIALPFGWDPQPAWLATPNSRALPEDHAVLWGNVAAGALRRGIAVSS